MARKERVESPTGYYHVMQRGVGKQILFEDDNDYQRYLNKLAECRSCMDFKLVAYCLMNNHVHLLVHADDIRTLSLLMNRLGSSYGRWYNIKYEHVGYVFQGRYLSEPISDESYLLACVRYIHNNPVKAGFGGRDEYRWSSYNEFFRESVGADGVARGPIDKGADGVARGLVDKGADGVARGLVDAEIVEGVLGTKAQFEIFSVSADDKVFIDDDAVVPCSVGKEIVRRHFGNEFENSLMVKQLCAVERNKIIKEMKAAGLSCHQIELVTGVSRKIVKRV